MPTIECPTTKVLKTILMPSVLLIVLASTQSNGSIEFSLDLPTPPKPTANRCTQCSEPYRNMKRISSFFGSTTAANISVPGVDAKGCSTLTYECPVLSSRYDNMIRFNGSGQTGEVVEQNKATLTCNANGKFEFQPQPETGMTSMEVTEVQCQTTWKKGN